MSSGRLLGNKTALSRLWAPLLDYGQRHKPDDQENADHGWGASVFALACCCCCCGEAPFSTPQAWSLRTRRPGRSRFVSAPKTFASTRNGAHKYRRDRLRAWSERTRTRRPRFVRWFVIYVHAVVAAVAPSKRRIEIGVSTLANPVNFFTGRIERTDILSLLIFDDSGCC